MTVFDDDFEAITIDTEADEQELLDLYKEKTGVTLSAAHSEKILISIIAYAKSLVLTKINECVKNLLLPYASGLWLDILGYLVGCERLSASQSVSTLQVNLYESYTSSKTLPAGAKIETSDGLYYFETTDDLVIEAGETSGTVTIQSVDAGAVLNYGIGEVNTLVESYEFIESVENITACTGGADEEDDDTYRSRIAVAPEQFSVAGPEDAYIYFVKSSSSSIVDCAVEYADDDAYITSDGTTYTESDNTITLGSQNITVDYNACTVTIPAGTYSSDFTVCFPKQSLLNIYILTDDGEASDEILETVADSLEEIKPMCDYIQVLSAERNEFELNPTVYIERSADFDTVQENVKTALNDYFDELKTQLNQAVLESTLITLIKNVTGVYDVDLGNFTSIDAGASVFNAGSIGDDITFARAS